MISRHRNLCYFYVISFFSSQISILHLYVIGLSINNRLFVDFGHLKTSPNKIPFFPFIFHKDFFGFILILCLYLLQTHFGISSFSHPDNALEVCGLLTPLHIVPEWYFLCQYAMLKAVHNKNAGFIILLTSIFTFFFFGEIRNLTTFKMPPGVNIFYLWEFLFFYKLLRTKYTRFQIFSNFLCFPVKM